LFHCFDVVLTNTKFKETLIFLLDPQRTYEDLTEAEFCYFDPPQAATPEASSDAAPAANVPQLPPEDSSATELREKKVIQINVRS
jgi:hypothetical protein